MLTRIARTVAVTSLAVGAALAGVQPAQAQVKTFHDPAPRLTTVWVDHGVKNVRVRATVGPMKIGTYFTFWLDTNPADAGPEYKLDVYPNSEVAPMRRVGSFTSNGTAVRCDGLRESADVFGDQVVSITVPRSCIGKPKTVRVSVRGVYEVPGPNVTDWAPGTQQFFGPVSSPA